MGLFLGSWCLGSLVADLAVGDHFGSLKGRCIWGSFAGSHMADICLAGSLEFGVVVGCFRLVFAFISCMN